MNKALEEWPKVIFSFSIILFIFFACSLASIDQCDKNCPSTNHDLNGFNYFTTVCGFLMALVMVFYTGIVQKDKIFKFSFGRRFGRR